MEGPRADPKRTRRGDPRLLAVTAALALAAGTLGAVRGDPLPNGATPRSTAPAADATLETAADGSSTPAVEVRTPHRIGFVGGAVVAAWERGATETTWLGDGGGEGAGAVRLDYHFMLNPWIGAGGSLALDIDGSGYPGWAGVSIAGGLRIGLWREWLFLEAEASAGYPWILAAVANLGLAIPIDAGVRLRVDNRFLFGLTDDCPARFAWVPAIGVELGL